MAARLTAGASFSHFAVASSEAPMSSPRILRLLRIAFSAVCGIICLLLIVLWIRSFWRQESAMVQIVRGQLIGALSVKQHITCSISPDIALMLPGHPPAPRWSLLSLSIAEFYAGKTEQQIEREIGLPKFPGFRVRRTANGSRFSCVIPYWCPILVAAAFSLTPWIHWSKRYSLRTLLIITTFAALFLGAIVYAVR